MWSVHQAVGRTAALRSIVSRLVHYQLARGLNGWTEYLDNRRGAPALRALSHMMHHELARGLVRWHRLARRRHEQIITMLLLQDSRQVRDVK